VISKKDLSLAVSTPLRRTLVAKQACHQQDKDTGMEMEVSVIKEPIP